MRGTKIYLRRDDQPIVVGVDERTVVDTLMTLPDDTFIGFPVHPPGHVAYVRSTEIVALVPCGIRAADDEDDGDDDE